MAKGIIVDKCTPSLRGEVLGADTTGPAVARVGTLFDLNILCSSIHQDAEYQQQQGRRSTLTFVVAVILHRCFGDINAHIGERPRCPVVTVEEEPCGKYSEIRLKVV